MNSNFSSPSTSSDSLSQPNPDPIIARVKRKKLKKNFLKFLKNFLKFLKNFLKIKKNETSN